ncbi:hypothetical protein GUJ93_ZPchr0011g28411 [Zizania palustris]|uniref:Uncharacterized protein n=1 Tax=Zizania palustris TaxID=103762 RepID=A0A8J5WJH9_ZIZPA|nr:hypothetical protein GUJ93_ZPchr0011g28411 [Zizania palustris]
MEATAATAVQHFVGFIAGHFRNVKVRLKLVQHDNAALILDPNKCLKEVHIGPCVCLLHFRYHKETGRD